MESLSGMGDKQSEDKRLEQAIFRILDANFDRAREGLRIIEEWCRFGINSSTMANECKELRQDLASWHHHDFRLARNTPADVGTQLSHPREEQRESIKHLLRANLSRVEEALRVLEEYSKLFDPEMASACKQMRYRVYTLESNLLISRRHRLLANSPLYLITSPSDQLLTIVEAALRGGITLIQYRDKNSKDTELLSQGQQLVQLCHHYGALLIVNDRVDIALAIDADGVHLGQQDMSVTFARQVLGSHKIIGLSTTNAQEMQIAITQKADYIGVGPVYETPTKPGKAAAGLDYIRYAVENFSLPWFAIGGIDTNNVNEVIAAGAERIAVVRAIMAAEQPTLVTQYFMSKLTRKTTLPLLGGADL